MSTRQISENINADGLKENKDSAKQGGSIAKNARKELESKTQKSVITKNNYLNPKKETKKLKD